MLLLLACATPERPETDVPYRGAAEWTLDGHLLRLAAGRVTGEGVAVEGVYDEPVFAGDTLWVPADPGPGDGGVWKITVEGEALRTALVVEGGRPDRLAVAEDGSLAFVSGRSGLASVWLRTPAGELRQLTNRGVRPTPGRAPEGFSAPPRHAPAFDADRLRWDGGDVPWR